MRSLIVMLALTTSVQASDFGNALKQAFSPQSILQNVANDFQNRGRIQSRYGNSMEGNANQALADDLRQKYGLAERANNERVTAQVNEIEIANLKNEIADLQKEVRVLRAFCVKVKNTLERKANQ